MIGLDVQTALLPHRFPHCFAVQLKIIDLQKLDVVDAQVDGPHVAYIPHNWQLDYKCHYMLTFSALQEIVMALIFIRKKDVRPKEQSEIFGFERNATIPL